MGLFGTPSLIAHRGEWVCVDRSLKVEWMDFFFEKKMGNIMTLGMFFL